MTRLHIQSVLLIDATTFFVSIICLSLIRFPSAGGAPSRARFRSDLRYAFRYLWTAPALLQLLGFFAVMNFLVGLVGVLLQPMVLGFAAPPALGFVLTCGGVGGLAGGIAMSVWGGPSRRIDGVLGFSVVCGVAIIIAGLRPSIPLVAVAAFLFNSSAALLFSCNQAVWQALVPAASQGRVFGMRSVVTSWSFPLAQSAAGPLADRVFGPLLLTGGAFAGSLGRVLGTGPTRGIGLLFVVFGVFCVAVTAVASSSNRLRSIEQPRPPEPVAGESEFGVSAG